MFVLSVRSEAAGYSQPWIAKSTHTHYSHLQGLTVSGSTRFESLILSFSGLYRFFLLVLNDNMKMEV